MFKKSIEAVIADGLQKMDHRSEVIQQVAKEARENVQKCRSEINSLVTLAQQVPEKVFDRYSNVLVSTIQIQSEHSGVQLQIGIDNAHLRGVMGPEVPPKGKYRVIVLLEPIS